LDGGKFFGAFRACSGIKDAVVINHVPVGCNWGAGMFRTASDQADVRQACTVMHEREIVFGGEEALRRALERADRLYDLPLMIVISGDLPSIIGDDVGAVISSLDLKKEVLWLEASGFKGFSRDGYEDALLALSPLMHECQVVKNSINLIGLCPDDFKVEADLKEIGRLMSAAGVTVNAAISRCSLDEFRRAPSAELNVVLGQGVRLAQLMEEKFGIPCLELSYPYGLDGTRSFVNSICDSLGIGYELDLEPYLEPFRKIFIYLHDRYGTPASVVGDFHAPPLARFLRDELGFEIEVLSSFEAGSSFGDEVRSSSTMVLFGSSFEQGIARELRIPLVRYVYPVFDHVSICDFAPYAGLRGAACLTETIANTIMGFDRKTEFFQDKKVVG